MLQRQAANHGTVLGGRIDVASGAAISYEDLSEPVGARKERDRGDVVVDAAVEVERDRGSSIGEALTIR